MLQLGRKPVVDEFVDRLILQKTVYLAQAAGVNLGYHYCWYLYGPYCRALAADGAVVAAEGTQEAEEWSLDDALVDRLRDISVLVNPERNTDKEATAKRLELLASVHFLIDHEQVSQDDIGEIEVTLRRYDKEFGKEEITGALGVLKEHGLLQ